MSLKGAFNKDGFERIKEGHREYFKCKGNMPWKGETEKCNLYPTTVQRGGLNTYFSKIESSIVIPPYSDSLNIQIEKSKEYQSMLSLRKKQEKKGKLEQFKEDFLDDYIDEIASEIKVNKKAVEIIVNRKIENLTNDKEEEIDTREKYREEEYEAFQLSETFV